MKVIYPEGGTTTGGGSGDVSYKAGDVVITNSANQPENSTLADGRSVSLNEYPDLNNLTEYANNSFGDINNIALSETQDLSVELSNGVDPDHDSRNSGYYFSANNNNFYIHIRYSSGNDYNLSVYKLDQNYNYNLIYSITHTVDIPQNRAPELSVVKKSDTEVGIFFKYGSEFWSIMFNSVNETFSGINSFNIPMDQICVLSDELSASAFVLLSNLSNSTSGNRAVYTSMDGINFTQTLSETDFSGVSDLRVDIFNNNLYNNAIYLLNDDASVIYIIEPSFSIMSEGVFFYERISLNTGDLSKYTISPPNTPLLINNTGIGFTIIARDNTSISKSLKIDLNTEEEEYKELDFEFSFLFLKGTKIFYTKGTGFDSENNLRVNDNFLLDMSEDPELFNGVQLTNNIYTINNNLFIPSYYYNDFVNPNFENDTVNILSFNESNDFTFLPNYSNLIDKDKKSLPYLIHTN